MIDKPGMTSPFKRALYVSISFCIMLVLISCIAFTLNDSQNSDVEYKLIQIELKKQNRKRPYIKASLKIHQGGAEAACKLPVLDPFQRDAMRVFRLETQRQYTCNIHKLSRLEEGRLIVNNRDGKIKAVTIEYILRGRRRKANGALDPPKGCTGILVDTKYDYNTVLNDDFHVHFSQPIRVQQNKMFKQFIMTHFERDFFRVNITMKSGDQKSEHHYHIANRTETCRKYGKSLDSLSKEKKGLPYNVHMILVDAQSRGNVYRQTRKFMKMLEQDENAMVFKGHGLQGDGTCCQSLATLAGAYLFNKHGLILVYVRTHKLNREQLATRVNFTSFSFPVLSKL